MIRRPGPGDLDRDARLRGPVWEIPVQKPESRVRNFDEVYLPWTRAMAMEEAARCLHCPDPPCVRGCPLGNDIPTALWLTEQGDLDGAAAVFQRTSNFSEICSRVCPQCRQCERGCPHLAEGHRAVAIGRIEGFLADRARGRGKWEEARRPAFPGHKVAVVGSGPAGLTAAELLALEGHCITVFERWSHGGGLLRYGIPRFKLDHTLIRERLDYLHRLGVEFVFDTRIRAGAELDLLFTEGFEAVFLGTGAGTAVPLGAPGERLAGVYQARDFLVRANVEQNLRPSELEEPPHVGRRVVVVGGGDTAMDCSRTARRLGAEEVTCFYRRSEDEMPGNPVDRRLAREEGIHLRCLASPVRILGDGRGRVRGVRFVRNTLGPEDASGRPSPRPVPGSHFEIHADAVVLALGFRAPPDLIGGPQALESGEGGLILVDPDTGRTSRNGVWAGGDNVRGSSLVAHVVAQARLAARDIHGYLAS